MIRDQPPLDLYWSTKHPLICVELSEVMSRVRFKQPQIPRGQPGHDRLFKVRKLFDPQFELRYNTYCELTIDEAVIKFKGRLGNGYVKRFQIYTGAGTAVEEHTTADDSGATARLVVGLVNGLEQNYPRLFVNNYFTSPY